MYTCSLCNNDSPADARFCSWCGTMISKQVSSHQFATGLLPSQSVLKKGRYSILERVGQGGMGAVYKAQDFLSEAPYQQSSKRAVAIKEMGQNGLTGQELQNAITAFTREAEILSHLKHQSLPHIYEQFEENGRHYLVMEFIEGDTLDYLLKEHYNQGKRLPIAQVLDIGRQLCAVLNYLHMQQPPVIFRDLKPANIMLDEHRRVYLIDFGIARLFKQGQLKDTVALGSQGYAPPEQYRHATSPRSDIYSLGATLHQMITGDDPSEAPFQFQPFSVNIPHLERLVTDMVALDEKQRPESMNEVLKVLDSIVQPQKSSTALGESGKRVSGPLPASAPITVYAVISPSVKDQKLWISLKDQLMSLLNALPKVEIKEDIVTGKNGSKQHFQAIDEANLILLLLSEDFLSSSECMTLANRAINRSTHERQGIEILSVLLYPCAWKRSRLAHIRTIPKDAIAHPSLYAQEQRILEIAKTIRKLLTTLVLAGKNGGLMNQKKLSLAQWLLWQLYGNGHVSCPYFVVGQYALKYIRASGSAGVLVHLLDLQDNHIMAEYIVGSPNRPDLTHLLQVIAPSHTDPETVQGVAWHDKPLEISLK